ncbi:MAG TPA: HAD family hydrolase [Maribacter sp.]|nr:HAD family hydrolase [Maribacter sp.]
MIKLIIFDLDGVLVEACEWHRIALNEALREVCDYEISKKDHEETFNGIPTRVKLKILSEKNIIKSECCESVYRLKQEKTVSIIEKNANQRIEKMQLIDRLKSDGFIVACFTNSIRKTAEMMLKKTGVLDKLDMLVTNQDVKKPKPSPEGYNKIVDYYKIDKENVYIVEDSPKGVESAKKSLCKVIVVKNSYEVDYNSIKEKMI